MAKFDRPFAEVRLFIPYGAESRAFLRDLNKVVGEHPDFAKIVAQFTKPPKRERMPWDGAI